jgi:hypothetical protein
MVQRIATPPIEAATAIMTVKVVLLVLVSSVVAAPETGAVIEVGVASTDWVSVKVGTIVLTEGATDALAILSVSKGAALVWVDWLAVDEAVVDDALASEAVTLAETEADAVAEALAVVDADADEADCEADAEADATEAEALVTDAEALAEAGREGMPAAPATGGRISESSDWVKGSPAGKGDRFFMRRLFIKAWSRACIEASWQSTRATNRER